MTLVIWEEYAAEPMILVGREPDLSLRLSMLCKLKAALAGIGFCAFANLGFAQDVRILLRPKDGKIRFHLGEPLTLEAACVDSVTGRYLLPCDILLKADGVSPGTRLSADRIDQLTWLDAQTGSLPPDPRGQCGNIDNKLPSEVSSAPTWREVTLQEPFPVYVGQYRITANLARDVEMAERFGVTEHHSSSEAVEIGMDDNLDWKTHLIHFHNCDYDDRLTLVPDAETLTALGKHLDDCAVEDDRSFAMLLHEIVWLKMQVEQPDLYSRMRELERTRPVLRPEDEADLQNLERVIADWKTQSRLNAANEANQIRKWFLDQYRGLLLQTAEQFVLAYKSHPELREDQDFQQNLEIGFENWHDAVASLPGGARAYLSAREEENFLEPAGWTLADIAGFLKMEQTNLGSELPEYRNRTTLLDGPNFSSAP